MTDAAATAKTEPEKTHEVAKFKHGAPLLACRFDPSGQFVFASAEDFSIQRWHIASGKVTPLAAHESWVWSLVFHPSGSTLFSAGYDGRLIFWDATAEAPQPQRTIAAHDGWARCVAVSPDGNLLATCGNDHLVKLWSAADGQLLDVLAGHTSHVYNAAFHPTRPLLYSGDLKGAVREWDLATGEQLRQLDAAPLWKYDEGFGADIGGVRSIGFDAEGRRLACGGITEVSNAFAGIGTPLVIVFDLETGEKQQSLLSTKKFRGKATGIVFHRDGYLIGSTSGHDGGHLLFWRLDAANEFFDLALPDSARGLDIHPDGVRLATCDPDGHVRLWQLTAKAA